jgi:hypothetical protein
VAHGTCDEFIPMHYHTHKLDLMRRLDEGTLPLIAGGTARVDEAPHRTLADMRRFFETRDELESAKRAIIPGAREARGERFATADISKVVVKKIKKRPAGTVHDRINKAFNRLKKQRNH